MMHKLAKLGMTESTNQCWKITGYHEEKVEEEQKLPHFPAVKILVS